MKRIGVAASRISQGSLGWYNFNVVVICFLFSLLMFIVTGSVIIFSLLIIQYIGEELSLFQFEQQKSFIFVISMVSLTAVIVLFNLFAILKNLKLPKRKR